MSEKDWTRTDIVNEIILEIDSVCNEQLLRLYREVVDEICEEDIDWEE